MNKNYLNTDMGDIKQFRRVIFIPDIIEYDDLYSKGFTHETANQSFIDFLSALECELSVNLFK